MSPMRDTTVKYLSSLHRFSYRVTRGRMGRRFVANDMLLLTTKGRRTSRDHTVPLLYLRDGNNIIVIGSYGGRDYPPDWFANLQAAPRVTVQIEGEKAVAIASPMDEPERTEWWQRFVAAYEGYANYQRRTDRIIPIIRLTPTIGLDYGAT